MKKLKIKYFDRYNKMDTTDYLYVCVSGFLWNNRLCDYSKCAIF